MNTLPASYGLLKASDLALDWCIYGAGLILDFS